MNRSVYGMQRDMHGMNRTVSSGPFGMMNDIMPFSSDTNVPPPLAPQPVWPAYGNQQHYQPYPVQPAVRQPVARQQAAPMAQPKAKVAEKPTVKIVPKENVTVKKTQKKVTMPGASPVSLREPSIKAP